LATRAKQRNALKDGRRKSEYGWYPEEVKRKGLGSKTALLVLLKLWKLSREE